MRSEVSPDSTIKEAGLGVWWGGLYGLHIQPQV